MNSVIILAAGKGSRMKASLNKQYLLLNNKPLIAHTIEAFNSSELIDEIVLVISNNDIDIFKDLIIDKYNYYKISDIVIGGNERQDSVYNGIKALDEKSEVVLIHDGARPFINDSIIKNCIDGANEYEAASAGVPVKDTIKIIDTDNKVISTPDRSQLWITQTPQSFKVDIIKKAHVNAKKDGFIGTDDASLVERLGLKVKMVEGDYKNIKITTPEDIFIGEAILNNT